MNEGDKKKIGDIAKKHGLALVALFGSRAIGLTHAKSDIDIGYLSPRVLDYRERSNITEEFMRIFRNRDVELVDLDQVSPDLNKQVADEGIVLFEEKKGVFDIFSIHAHRRYLDTKPLREYRYQYVKDFLHAHA